MKAYVHNIPSVYGKMAWGPRGMGQDDGSEIDNVDTSYVASPSEGDLQAISSAAGIPTQGTINTTNGTTNPAVSTSAATAAVASIASAFTSIFKAIQPVPQGCTQIQTLQGTSTQCLAAGQTSTLGNSLAASLSTGSGTWLLIGGAILVFMMMEKK